MNYLDRLQRNIFFSGGGLSCSFMPSKSEHHGRFSRGASRDRASGIWSYPPRRTKTDEKPRTKIRLSRQQGGRASVVRARRAFELATVHVSSFTTTRNAIT